MKADRRAPVSGEQRLRSCRHGRIGKQAERKTRKAAAAAAAGDANKGAGIGCSELKLGSKTAGAAKSEEEAPRKKMTRLPQAEVRWILAQANDDDHAPACVKDWYRQNPGRRPTEEEDEDALLFIEIQEEFGEFQAWIRSEYEKNGYVEVDEDFLAHRAQVQAWSDEAREASLKKLNLSEEDEDLKIFYRRACP